MVFSSTLDSTVYMTTTNQRGDIITYAPTYITTTAVYTNSRGQPVTVTRIVSNPSLIPGDNGGGASAFFHNKAAVVGVFTAIGLVIIVILCLLIWNLRSRHKRQRLAHENAVADFMEGRRSTGRLTLIDDDEDDSGHGYTSSALERSSSGHRRASTHSSSNGRMSPIDSAGQMTSRTPFPPVSLLAASYNRRKSSSSHGHGRSGGGNGGRYTHVPTHSDGMEFGRKSPSPPPRFSQECYQDPFSDSSSVPFLLGTKGGYRSNHPAVVDEFEPIPLTLGTPISPDRARYDLFAQKREFGYENARSSITSLNTGASTPKDLEVRNVFDEEFGSVPAMRRKPMLAVHSHP